MESGNQVRGVATDFFFMFPFYYYSSGGFSWGKLLLLPSPLLRDIRKRCTTQFPAAILDALMEKTR